MTGEPGQTEGQQKVYTRPELKKHGELRQVTFSSGGREEPAGTPQRPVITESPVVSIFTKGEAPPKITTDK